MPVTSKTTVTNQAGASPSDVALIVANTDFAFQQWAKLLIGNATIEINVNIVGDLGDSTLAQASSNESVCSARSERATFISKARWPRS